MIQPQVLLNESNEIIINELSASPIHETNLMSYLNANTSLINYEQDGDTFNLNFNEPLIFFVNIPSAVTENGNSTGTL